MASAVCMREVHAAELDEAEEHEAAAALMWLDVLLLLLLEYPLLAGICKHKHMRSQHGKEDDKT